MGGTNPYIKSETPEPPKQRYSVTFANNQTVIEVEPSKVPFTGTGHPGSILDIALGNHIDIDHACGGVSACSTCHVYIKEGLSSCSEASEEELDMLELAPDLKPYSRLSCQCVPSGKQNIVVEIPDWNRNLVREGK